LETWWHTFPILLKLYMTFVSDLDIMVVAGRPKAFRLSRYVTSPTVLTYSVDSLRRLCVLMLLHEPRVLFLGSVGYIKDEKDETP
jgi:hypothetical protein